MPSSDAEPAGNVGQRLRAVRKQRGLTLRDVAALSDGDFRISTLSVWERGDRRVSIPVLRRLADIYRVPIAELLGDDRSAPDRRTGVTIDMRRLAKASSHWDGVKTFAARITAARQGAPLPLLRLRWDDLEAIAATMGTDAESLQQRLVQADIAVPTRPESQEPRPM